MYVERHNIDLTTDGDGAATGYSPRVTGRILNVIYTKTDFANGVDFTITAEDSGLSILAKENVDASATFAPMQSAHDQTGTAWAVTDQNDPWPLPIVLVNERVKVVVASGGATKTGTVTVVIG